MLGIRSMSLAGSPAVANRPAEAARCLESRTSTRTRVYDPNMPDVARTFCAQSKPIPIRDQCQLEVGWARVARAVSLAPTTSLHFSRSKSRGRSDLHSPDDAWTIQTHASPGMLPDRRGMNAAYSPFRQNGDSRLAATGRSGVREQIDGLGWQRATLCIGNRDPRDYALFCHPGGRQAPIFRQESEGGIRRRMRKQPGGEERMALVSGYGTVGPSSWHVWIAI
jgi:hypothetical protein